MFLPDLDETTKYFETFKSVANPASASSAAGKSFSGTKSALLPIQEEWRSFGCIIFPNIEPFGNLTGGRKTGKIIK